jgi:hypothetical protein
MGWIGSLEKEAFLFQLPKLNYVVTVEAWHSVASIQYTVCRVDYKNSNYVHLFKQYLSPDLSEVSGWIESEIQV